MDLFPWRKKKETIVCPNCKCPVPAGSVFCDACGLRILAPPSCMKCSLPLAPDTNFCEACGTPVAPQVMPAEQIPEADGPETPKTPPRKKESKRRKKRKGGGDDGETGRQPIAVEDRPVACSNAPIYGKPDEESLIVPAPGDQIPAVSEGIASPADTGFSKRKRIVAAGAFLFVILIVGVVFFMHPLNDPAPPLGRQNNSYAGAKGTMGGMTEHEGIATQNGTGTLPSLLPGPTRVVPESMRIWFQAERDPVTHHVTVLFDGGKGQRAVYEVQVRLTRSDGQVLTGSFRPLVIGEGVSLPGTRYTDRLEVIVVYNSGETYTVIDKNFLHKERN